MKKTLAVTGALAALPLLAACAGEARAEQVMQQCAIIYSNGTQDPADDYAKPIDDDYCEDGVPGYGWYYGGVAENGFYYHGTLTRPSNVVIVVRQPDKGGSARTTAKTRAYNDTAAKHEGKQSSTTTQRHGDSRRDPKVNVGTGRSSTGGFGSTGTSRSSGGRR